MPLHSRPLLLRLALGLALFWLLPSGEASAQPFSFTLVQNDLAALDYGALAYADLDRDGDLDMIASGNSNRISPFRPTTYIALSLSESLLPNGRWQHIYERTTLPTEVWHSAVTWIDYDGDSHLDFVLTGTDRSGAIFENLPFRGVTRLFHNNGSGQFEQVEAGLVGVYSSSVARGDYDNDGDTDLLITGLADAETPVAQLYRNDNGTFAPADSPFPALAFGDADWADYDSDGDLDLLLSGADVDGTFATLLYRNDGAGSFTEVDAGFRGLAFSSFDWADYDNDGDLDLALSGGTLSLPNFFDGVAEIYRNDAGRFTRLDAGLEGILYGNVVWGDYDNDGDADLLVIGADDVTNGRTGRIYRNEGGVFAPRLALVGVAASSVAWGDYDGDDDLDVLTTGSNLSFNPLTQLYRNDQLTVNTIPTAPTGLQASTQGNTTTLTWNSAEDDQTPSAGLTYTLRVGTAPGASNIVAALADPASGQRWVPSRGNVDHNTRWTLTNLPAGTYYWSVQAVDHSFKGSPFAEEGSFTISANADVGTNTETETGLPKEFALYQSFPNPFQTATTIAYDLPQQTPVRLTIYNVLGAEVTHLIDQVQPAGRQQVVWNGRDATGRRVGAGVYFVRMQAGRASWTRQVVLFN